MFPFSFRMFVNYSKRIVVVERAIEHEHALFLFKWREVRMLRHLGSIAAGSKSEGSNLMKKPVLA